MNALDVSPYLRLTPRAEADVRADTAQLEAMGAFSAMFPGETHAVYVVSYWTDRYVAQEFFPAGITKAGVIQGLIDAKDTFADAGEPSYPNPSYINCIEFLPNGTYRPVQLFRSE